MALADIRLTSSTSLSLSFAMLSNNPIVNAVANGVFQTLKYAVLHAAAAWILGVLHVAILPIGPALLIGGAIGFTLYLVAPVIRYSCHLLFPNSPDYAILIQCLFETIVHTTCWAGYTTAAVTLLKVTAQIAQPGFGILLFRIASTYSRSMKQAEMVYNTRSTSTLLPPV